MELVKNFSCFNYSNWTLDLHNLSTQNRYLKKQLNLANDQFSDSSEKLIELQDEWQKTNNTYEEEITKYLNELNLTIQIVNLLNAKYSNQNNDSNNSSLLEENEYTKLNAEEFLRSDKIYLLDMNKEKKPKQPANDLPFLIEIPFYDNLLAKYLDGSTKFFSEQNEDLLFSLAETESNESNIKTNKFQMQDIQGRLNKVKTLNFLLEKIIERINNKMNYTNQTNDQAQAKFQSDYNDTKNKQATANDTILNISQMMDNNSKQIKDLNEKILLCEGKPLSYRKCAQIYNGKERKNQEVENMVNKINEIIKDLLNLTKENITINYLNTTRCKFGNESDNETENNNETENDNSATSNNDNNGADTSNNENATINNENNTSNNENTTWNNENATTNNETNITSNNETNESNNAINSSSNCNDNTTTSDNENNTSNNDSNTTDNENTNETSINSQNSTNDGNSTNSSSQNETNKNFLNQESINLQDLRNKDEKRRQKKVKESLGDLDGQEKFRKFNLVKKLAMNPNFLKRRRGLEK